MGLRHNAQTGEKLSQREVPKPILKVLGEFHYFIIIIIHFIIFLRFFRKKRISQVFCENWLRSAEIPLPQKDNTI